MTLKGTNFFHCKHYLHPNSCMELLHLTVILNFLFTFSVLLLHDTDVAQISLIYTSFFLQPLQTKTQRSLFYGSSILIHLLPCCQRYLSKAFLVVHHHGQALPGVLHLQCSVLSPEPNVINWKGLWTRVKVLTHLDTDIYAWLSLKCVHKREMVLFCHWEVT